MDQTLQQLQAWATVAAAIAGAFTFFALIWYTIETQRLRRAAERQNDIAGMPIVLLKLSSVEQRPGGLLLDCESIRNVGNGPAFDINISAIQKAPFEIRFEPIHLLEPKQTYVLDITVWRDVGVSVFSKMSVWLESVIESGELGSEMPVDISYADAAGKRYRSRHVVQYDAVAKRVSTGFQGHGELP